MQEPSVECNSCLSSTSRPPPLMLLILVLILINNQHTHSHRSAAFPEHRVFPRPSVMTIITNFSTADQSVDKMDGREEKARKREEMEERMEEEVDSQDKTMKRSLPSSTCFAAGISQFSPNCLFCHYDYDSQLVY